VRTEDVLFALNQLELLNSNTNSPFVNLFDLQSIAVAGHSLGGITASEACKGGGSFSTEETAIPPEQPFRFLTKESQLPPKWIEKFESTTEGYRVVIHGASHESFTDGPMLQPGLLPTANRADRIMSLIEKYTLAFRDRTLKNQQSNLISKSENLQDVTVEVYPSE